MGCGGDPARNGSSAPGSRFLFGLGFDTTTEVLPGVGTTTFLALQHIPWYAICCLPVLFTAGMALMDTSDCIFMNLAYGWAFFNPVRKVFYNLAITGLSVGICFLVGGIETLGLISTEVKGLSRGNSRVLGHSCATSTSTWQASRSSACSS